MASSKLGKYFFSLVWPVWPIPPGSDRPKPGKKYLTNLLNAIVSPSTCFLMPFKGFWKWVENKKVTSFLVNNTLCYGALHHYTHIYSAIHHYTHIYSAIHHNSHIYLMYDTTTNLNRVYYTNTHIYIVYYTTTHTCIVHYTTSRV